jgi:hypothetical protein
MIHLPIIRNLPIQFSLSQKRLEHEIEMIFEDIDAYEHIKTGQKEFDLYFEIKRNEMLFIIEGKYRIIEPVYKKDDIKCSWYDGKKLIPCKLKILPYNFLDKRPIIDIIDEILEKEKERIAERTRDEQMWQRTKEIYGVE